MNRENWVPSRDARGRFLKGNPGKPRGAKDLQPRVVQNARPPSIDIKVVAQRVLLGPDTEAGIAKLARRIQNGEAPHLEKFFAEHLWGKPKETVELRLTEVRLLAVRQMSDLELGLFLEALEGKREDEALSLLPGDAA